ncbi:MAG: oligosaccharide flippase family protein [Candidatus Eisenbacteria bacterium]
MSDRAAVRRGLGRQIARNSALGLVGRFFSVLGWTLIAPWMLHVLGSERFGLWSLFSIFSSLALTFDLGLQGALTRYVAEHRAGDGRGPTRALLGMGLALYLALGLLLFGGAALLRGPLLDFFHIAPELRAEAGGALLLAAAATLALNLSQYGGAVLGGLQRLDRWSQVSMAGTFVQIAVSALVLARGGGVTHLLAVSALVNLAAAGASAAWALQIDPTLTPAFSGWTAGLWRGLGGFSLAMQVVGVGLLLQFQLDKVLFGRWVGLTAVAEYELAYRVAFGAWALPALLLPPLLPAVAHLHAAGDHDGVVALLRRATRYVLALALPLAAGLVALSPTLLAAWLGPGHESASRAAVALGVVLGATILTGAGSAVVRGMGRPGVEAWYFVVAAAVHVPLSLWWIPRYGFTGGLWALVVSGIVGPVWFVVRLHRFLGLSLAGELRQRIAPPLFASVVAGVAGAEAARFVAGLGAGRSIELAAFVVGGTVLVSIAGGALLLVRYVTLAELRGLFVRPAVVGGPLV